MKVLPNAPVEIQRFLKVAPSAANATETREILGSVQPKLAPSIVPAPHFYQAGIGLCTVVARAVDPLCLQCFVSSDLGMST